MQEDCLVCVSLRVTWISCSHPAAANIAFLDAQEKDSLDFAWFVSSALAWYKFVSSIVHAINSIQRQNKSEESDPTLLEKVLHFFVAPRGTRDPRGLRGPKGPKEARGFDTPGRQIPLGLLMSN